MMESAQTGPHLCHGPEVAVCCGTPHAADTLAQSYIHRTSIEAGAAAATSETKKITKYSLLSDRHEFVPVAIETLGTWGERGLVFINELGKRIAEVSGDNRSTAFLKQRMSLAVQRDNAAAVHGTLVAVDDDYM